LIVFNVEVITSSTFIYLCLCCINAFFVKAGVNNELYLHIYWDRKLTVLSTVNNIIITITKATMASNLRDKEISILNKMLTLSKILHLSYS